MDRGQIYRVSSVFSVNSTFDDDDRMYLNIIFFSFFYVPYCRFLRKM